MPTSSAPEPSAPRWLSVWLALVPVVYLLSPLSLVGLRYWQEFPLTARWLLGFYALSQQLPALFSPEPLLSSLLALLRTGLMFGLMGIGARLERPQRLWPLALGLGVVYLTAVVYSLSGSLDFLISRLGHPYLTAISLGLAGAVGVWFALFLGGRWWWRWPLGIMGLGVLLLSGSRGPLLAALVGVLAVLLLNPRRQRWLVAGVGLGLLGLGLWAGQHNGVAALKRLSGLDSSGREIVWANTLSVVRAQPWSGVGPYRLGKQLAVSHCVTFTKPDLSEERCPAWLEQLGQPWLIAHNITLQQWVEGGPLSVLGLFTVLGLVLWRSLSSRDPLALAINAGLLAATLTDNTLLVPSPFFAELFWLVAGMRLKQLSGMDVQWRSGLVVSGLLGLLSLPVLALVWPRPREHPPALELLYARTTVQDHRDYQVFVRFGVPPGAYRVALNSCLQSCRPLAFTEFQRTVADQPIVPLLVPQLPAVSRQRLELDLYRLNSLSVQPWGTYRWEVTDGP